MERELVPERPDRALKLEAAGLSFHSWDDYWNEGVCYRLTSLEVDELEAITNELYRLCLAAVEHLVSQPSRMRALAIPEQFWSAICASWRESDFSLYGRFDLAFDGSGQVKMLEFNGDTPTSLLESAVAQWQWQQDVRGGADQFNSIHERLIEAWRQMQPANGLIHFTSPSYHEEDWVCVHYLMNVAAQAGHEVKHIYLGDIGWNTRLERFVDLDEIPIDAAFKLYPWEQMMREPFSVHLQSRSTLWIEPIWKSMLSNKGLLVTLWELFPDHPNLLPTYWQPDRLTSYARKPLFGREGANIELIDSGKRIASDSGPYGAEGHVYQALHLLPDFDGFFPVLGSWVVGGQAAGVCFREDSVPITTNLSHFVPHYFV
jgi:glutathionylspermidine synthase